MTNRNVQKQDGPTPDLQWHSLTATSALTLGVMLSVRTMRHVVAFVVGTTGAFLMLPGRALIWVAQKIQPQRGDAQMQRVQNHFKEHMRPTPRALKPNKERD